MPKIDFSSEAGLS